MANRTMLRQCLMQQSRALSTSSRLTHAAPTSSQAAPANPAPGLGLGEVRTGIERIHRVKVDPPAFLSVPKTCAVIGAPFTYGQPVHGVDNGLLYWMVEVSVGFCYPLEFAVSNQRN
eukprot:TRINITY_DN6858_c0_g1_i2.p2 TRINITY_DN6858_c0_g1~~TRINITY_DN6858_c0_g1_i2.p2  ORF type:complete len:117 (+),score=4.03 TRINITY_DN6858_c0_g1_i2:104-454(+)